MAKSKKEPVKIYVLNYEAPQGEVDFNKLLHFVVSEELFGQQRPSKSGGWWKLSNGHWARRRGAIFMKINGIWSEITVTNNNPFGKLGFEPLQKASEEALSKPASIEELK